MTNEELDELHARIQTYTRPEVSPAELAALIAAARERNALAEERDDLQANFDLRWKADMRAIKQWQIAHPGKELTWPDHADLCVWLIELLAALLLQAGVSDLGSNKE